MRFRCPSLSTNGSSNSIASSSKHVHGSQKNTGKRTRSSAGAQDWKGKKKASEIRMSFKASEMQEGISKRPRAHINHIDYTFVYVGNLDPVTTEQDLAKHFTRCGKVLRVQMRSSQGQGLAIGVRLPAEIRTRLDSSYATVEFRQRSGVYNALKLHTSVLNGQHIVVTMDPYKVPEVVSAAMLRAAGMNVQIPA